MHPTSKPHTEPRTSLTEVKRAARGPASRAKHTVTAQNYLGEFVTAIAAAVIAELVKRLFDKRKERDNHEPHSTQGPAPEQEE